MRNFMLICPIHFEDLLIWEMQTKWSLYFETDTPKFTKCKGGVEIECLLHEGLALNKILKIPGRILLRLRENKCRDLPKLYHFLKKINWHLYLDQEEVEWHISAKRSRLIHTTKIEDSARKALRDYFSARHLSKKQLEKSKDLPPQKIFIRLQDDYLQISLDTSGELLHLRGEKTYRGHAPLRENFAACLVASLISTNSVSHLTLVDPMCGSASFLTEAQDFFKLTTRAMAFERWQKIPLLSANESLPFADYLGFDIDSALIEKVKKESEISIQYRDVFQVNKLDGHFALLCNPPYGKRVKLDQERNVYFKNLIDSIVKNFSPVFFGIIIPSDIKIAVPKAYLKQQRINFLNNGIAVHYYLFQRKA